MCVCACVRALTDLKMICCSVVKYFNTNVPDPSAGVKKFVPVLAMKEYGGVDV